MGFWFSGMKICISLKYITENKRSSLDSIYVFDVSVSRSKLTGCPSPTPS